MRAVVDTNVFVSGLLNKHGIPRKIFLAFKERRFVFPEEKLCKCRDPADNVILEAALAGKVTFIVTGDDDLLSLKSFRSIRILTPRRFIKELGDL